MNKSTIGFAGALFIATLAATGVPGSAHPFELAGKTLPAHAGYVNANGTIAFGSGFTVAHTGTGQYKITYPQKDFQYFPAMAVTPFGLNGGLPIANLNGVSCGSGSCIFYVGTYSAGGTAMDNGFNFVIVEAK